MKKTISREIDDTNIYFLDGPIDEVINKLLEHKENGVTDIEVKYRSWDNEHDITFLAKREETDEEYAARLEVERLEKEKLENEKQKKKQAKFYADYQTYLKLKEKFET